LFDFRSTLAASRSAAWQEWLTARDKLYENIMTHAWNPKERFFSQSYEDNDVLDSGSSSLDYRHACAKPTVSSAVLIMPLVFFSAPVRTGNQL